MCVQDLESLIHKLGATDAPTTLELLKDLWKGEKTQTMGILGFRGLAVQAALIGSYDDQTEMPKFQRGQELQEVIKESLKTRCQQNLGCERAIDQRFAQFDDPVEEILQVSAKTNDRDHFTQEEFQEFHSDLHGGSETGEVDLEQI